MPQDFYHRFLIIKLCRLNRATLAATQAAGRQREEAEFNCYQPGRGHSGGNAMASIKHIESPAGDPRFVVNYRHQVGITGRRRVFPSLNMATAFLYEVEAAALGWRTVESIEARKAWTLQKLVWFFLGYQVTRLDINAIQPTTFDKYRYELLAIKGTILNKQIAKITMREFQQASSSAGLAYLRSAFGLLIKMKLLEVNPITITKKYTRKPISIPKKSAVNSLLNDYAPRERIACYLGSVCALRIGEALAVTYEDVTERGITINKHVTSRGITSGMKRGTQRRIPMPKGLWQLLDPELLGSKKPLLTHSITGNPLTYAYVRASPLAIALKEQGVNRFHDLRHFAVSRLAERGFDIVRVSKLIGHSRPSITMDVYGHLFGDILEMDLD